MAAFLNTQLDFIFFFYGLAFILLGTICFAIARGGKSGIPWSVLGLFGYVHGIGEWLDLTALVIGDVPVFATARTVGMTISFIFLLEFARLEGRRLGYKLPGIWIYLPVSLLILWVGLDVGLSSANATARYTLGLTGALGTSLVLALHLRHSGRDARYWVIAAAAGFAVYGIVAGAVVPPAPFWPASVLNHGSFARVMDMPVQLVRGLLACGIAFSIWAYWGQQLIREAASPRYTKFMQRQFVWTLVAMAAILVGGWVLTEYLGGIYKANVQSASRGDLDLVSSRLAGETATVEGMVKAMAGDSSVHTLLGGSGKSDAASVNALVGLHVEASGASRGYILDRAGSIVAESDGGEAKRNGTLDLASAPYFQRAIAGEAGHFFTFDTINAERNFYASYPIRGERGTVVGVAILAKSLDPFERDLRRFERPVFLIDPNGIVALTNRPSAMLRTMWPLAAPVQNALTRQFGALNTKPMVDQEMTDGSWVMVDGMRDYVRRRNADHSDWSIVLLTVPHGIFASRVLGIIITLQMATLMLVYLVGRERWVQDSVHLDKRNQLEEVARNLDFKATTDPLTGLYNRAKLNQELAIEMMRAERYQTPLSLVLYDVDYFKNINDSRGHQAGDEVLIELSRFTAAHIRSVDVLARWGGEEFVLLVPGSDGAKACRMADNLRAAIGKLKPAGEQVTCSFGVAQYEAADTMEMLVARADEALYRAKVNGRNRVELAASDSLVPRIESVA